MIAYISNLNYPDYKAYKRLVTLGEDVKFDDRHGKFVIKKVPSVDCKSSCAIEFLVKGGEGAGDFYSHNFTITTTEAALPVSGSAIPPADKSTSASGGSAQANGPITLVQNAAKGAQPQSSGMGNSASSIASKGALAMALTAVVGMASYLI
ncbi:hypothetical protein BGZ76_001459 [Entomortierella beljakovae]|nr:hypothetical protein BGZ76_001459 [Entomortierella beljakovae]